MFRNAVILIAAFSVLSIPVFADTEITISPSSPAKGDTLTISVSGEFPDPSYELISHSAEIEEISTDDVPSSYTAGRISIRMYVNKQTEGVWPAVTVDWAFEETVGPLGPYSYSIEVTEEITLLPDGGQTLEWPASLSFTVPGSGGTYYPIGSMEYMNAFMDVFLSGTYDPSYDPDTDGVLDLPDLTYIIDVILAG